MVITDPLQADNPIVFANEAFQKLTGYTRDEIIGRNCRFLQGPETDRASVAKVAEAVAAGTDIAIDLLNYRKDGSTFWNALYLSPVRNANGDIGFFFASQLDVTDRIEAQRLITRQKEEVDRLVNERTADLRAALEAKDLLLHEVDHRVKNNLTMIGSLLRMQARTIGDPAVASKIKAMTERVDALATVHRRLYQSDDITMFDVGSFLENLVSDIVGSTGRSDIVPRVDVIPFNVPSSKAAAVGLILNELLTNAIKHGFADGRSGRLEVMGRADGADAVLTIANDGPEFDPSAIRDSTLGTSLVQRLSRQVDGSVRWDSSPERTEVTFRIPMQVAS